MTFRTGAIVVFACALLASCGRGDEATPTLAAQPAAEAPAGAGSMLPHGDHNPRHGGMVLMYGDLHFEVVLTRDGSERVYFSDATRSELPAATASGVAITITGKSAPPTTTALHIDDSGESWIGRGPAVADPAATARIAFKTQGKPYFIDVPFPR